MNVDTPVPSGRKSTSAAEHLRGYREARLDFEPPICTGAHVAREAGPPVDPAVWPDHAQRLRALAVSSRRYAGVAIAARLVHHSTDNGGALDNTIFARSIQTQLLPGLIAAAAARLPRIALSHPGVRCVMLPPLFTMTVRNGRCEVIPNCLWLLFITPVIIPVYVFSTDDTPGTYELLRNALPQLYMIDNIDYNHSLPPLSPFDHSNTHMKIPFFVL